MAVPHEDVPTLAALPAKCTTIDGNDPDHVRARGLIGKIAPVPSGLWGDEFERVNRGVVFPCRIVGYVPGDEPKKTERFYVADHHSGNKKHWGLEPIQTSLLKKAFQKAGNEWPAVKRVAPIFGAGARTGFEEEEDDEEDNAARQQPATRNKAWSSVPAATQPTAGTSTATPRPSSPSSSARCFLSSVQALYSARPPPPPTDALAFSPVRAASSPPTPTLSLHRPADGRGRRSRCPCKRGRGSACCSTCPSASPCARRDGVDRRAAAARALPPQMRVGALLGHHQAAEPCHACGTCFSCSLSLVRIARAYAPIGMGGARWSCVAVGRTPLCLYAHAHAHAARSRRWFLTFPLAFRIAPARAPIGMGVSMVVRGSGPNATASECTCACMRRAAQTRHRVLTSFSAVPLASRGTTQRRRRTSARTRTRTERTARSTSTA